MENIVHLRPFLFRWQPDKLKCHTVSSMIYCILTALVMLFGTPSCRAERAEDMVSTDPLPPFVIFTHGEAPSSFKQLNGELSGPAVEAANCAADHLGTAIDWQFAPLSRANQLMETESPQLWTPATRRTTISAGRPFVGPVGTISIFWYLRADDDRNPTSQEFRNNALVTAYPGSRTVDILLDRKYRVVTGRPEHRGMLDLLLRKRVDALLAVDFRHQLPNDMRTRFESSVRLVEETSFEIGYSASNGYTQIDHKERLDLFASALAGCSLAPEP